MRRPEGNSTDSDWTVLHREDIGWTEENRRSVYERKMRSSVSTKESNVGE